MALETGTYISDLVATNPTSSDAKAQGDDHLRLIKSTIKATFPNINAPVTATPAQLNAALTNGTAVASTSGTAIDFTGIPSWVKRITIGFSAVSLTGAQQIQFQLGGSGGIETTGYSCAYTYSGSLGSGGNSVTSGFALYAVGAAVSFSGSIVLTLLDAATNTWIANGSFGDASTIYSTTGSKATAATLDRVRITTITASAFDAGLVNIQYQ